MAFVPETRTYAPGAATTGAVIDTGLRAYMLRVYNWMASGLLLTGITSYAIANTSLIELFYHRVHGALASSQPSLATPRSSRRSPSPWR